MTDALTQETFPTPALQQRDDIGRLVAVTWHGTAGSDDTANGRWLVAVDGSACSTRAVAMVAGLAALEKGSRVDVVHIQPWLSKEAAETALPQRGWAATAQAREVLDAANIRWHLHVVMGDGAPEIARLADALESRGIAIGSRGLSATESLLLGSVAYQVVHLAGSPVLIVR